MVDAERFHCGTTPLHSALALHPEDVCLFVNGTLDEALVEDLLFGLLLIRWSDAQAVNAVRKALSATWDKPLTAQPVSRSWALLKHLFLPNPVRTRSGEEIVVRPDPVLVPLLIAGRVNEACRIAARRLFSAGLNPIRAEFADGEDGTRLAASLLIPIRRPYEISRLVLIPGQYDTTIAKGR
jgi:CRISPR-associated protein Csx17